MNTKQVKHLASQPKRYSLLESVVNIIVGLGINIGVQMVIFPIFGIHIPLGDNLKIAGIFTVISIIRSFCLRRAFNWWHCKKI